MGRASETGTGGAQDSDSRDGSPAVFTIDPGTPFVDALAAGVLARASGDPLALARVTILLPTRRACRTLCEAFLRQGQGRALLLPRLQPIGDVDDEEFAFIGAEEPALAAAAETPPAISELTRRLLLTQLIRKRGDPPVTVDQAAWLAADLARLLDQAQAERCSFDGLAALVPENYAEHWRQILDFLTIVTREWPKILADRGALDPAERRDRLITALAESWRREPPSGPVIAAGSTGSIPATADLLDVVARLPRGCVVLPGLERTSDEASWQALEASHPQYGMARLLHRLGVERADVKIWDAPALPGRPSAPASRAMLVAEAMRPAETSNAWREDGIDAALASSALDGVSRIDCPGPVEEAGVIALVMRGVLESEGRTAALVTADRDLARRVAADLRRWDIEIDDSAGVPLASTPPGAFLRLVAELAAGDLAPVPLLAALKHPLAAGGKAPAAFRSMARTLELAALRGPRPAAGFAGLRKAVAKATRADALPKWLDDLARRCAPLLDAMRRDGAALGDLIDAHVRVAEALAASDKEDGAARLWAGDAGEAAAGFIAEMRRAVAGFPDIEPRRYPAMLDALLAGRAVRPRYGRHPRLHIWGPLEARLQHADVMILGGLNEATWPAEPAADPWMSRPMRKKFGLPEPDRRIGLAAHDFAQAFCAPHVVLSRATRVEGAPTVPSRWLLRLETVLAGIGLFDRGRPGRAPWSGGDWLRWHRLLDRPGETVPISRPAPRPPVAARPRRLSVTQIETWQRDPYAIYARHILKLRPLDALDKQPGPAERGTLIHKVLERFVRDCPMLPAGEALDCLLRIGEEEFETIRDLTGLRAFWWPRFERVARWIVDYEGGRDDIAQRSAEAKGTWDIDAPGGVFTISARADRIDRLSGGGLEIIDYKTGALPTKKSVRAGYEPQLPLEAAIAREGGFGGIAAAPVERLTYWRLSGGDPAGERREIDEAEFLAEEALGRLAELVAHYDDPATTYAALPDPERRPRFSDYAHLARFAEWLAAGGGGE